VAEHLWIEMTATGQPSQPHPASSPAWPAAARASRRRAGWRRRTRWALLARWHADTLDHALASGAGPYAGALLAVRAQQLTTAHSRRRLAGGLARVRRDAVDELSGFTAVVAPDRHEVAAAAPEITNLERRLRDGARVDAAGVAMLRLLLTDGESPLYDPVGAGSLARHLRAVAGALGAPVR
jgi:hypothetical protein